MDSDVWKNRFGKLLICFVLFIVLTGAGLAVFIGRDNRLNSELAAGRADYDRLTEQYNKLGKRFDSIKAGIEGVYQGVLGVKEQAGTVQEKIRKVIDTLQKVKEGLRSIIDSSVDSR